MHTVLEFLLCCIVIFLNEIDQNIHTEKKGHWKISNKTCTLNSLNTNHTCLGKSPTLLSSGFDGEPRLFVRVLVRVPTGGHGVQRQEVRIVFCEPVLP